MADSRELGLAISDVTEYGGTYESSLIYQYGMYFEPTQEIPEFGSLSPIKIGDFNTRHFIVRTEEDFIYAVENFTRANLGNAFNLQTGSTITQTHSLKEDDDTRGTSKNAGTTALYYADTDSWSIINDTRLVDLLQP